MHIDDTPSVEQQQVSVPPADEHEEKKAETEAQEAEGDGESEDEESSKSETAEDAEGDKAEDGEKPKRVSRSERYQRQIDRLRRENEDLRSRSGSQSEEDVASAVERVIGKPPKEDEFKGDYLAYERALTAYELDKRQTTREIKTQAERRESQNADRRRELAEAHNDRMEEFGEKVKDFTDVMKGADNLKASPVVEELILDSDKSAHLVYFLAKNPRDLEKLNRMSERDAAREIGRIEQRLSLPEPRKQTQAPRPNPPPKGGAKGTFDPHKASTEEYAKARANGWRG